MNKAKLSVAAIVSSAAIAGGVLLSSMGSADACRMSKSDRYNHKYEQESWLRSPWGMVITLPGIALATALYMSGRSYRES